MSPFEFATAARIIFGEGTVQQVAPAALQWGRRVLVVTGSAPRAGNRLRADLEAAGAQTFAFAVSGEPTVELIARGLQEARHGKCRETVVGSPDQKHIECGLRGCTECDDRY